MKRSKGILSPAWAGVLPSRLTAAALSVLAGAPLWTAALCLYTLPASAAPRPSAARLSTYATLTTDYRKRGLSQSEGDAAIQAGLDYQHPSGWFAGLWGSSAAYPATGRRAQDEAGAGGGAQPVGTAGYREQADAEVEGYTGYTWRNPKWSATAAVARYMYPGVAVDYDYNEASAGFGYRERVFVTLFYTDALLSVGPSLFAAEATFAVPLPLGIELGGTLGRVHSNAYSEGGYTHWNAGLSRPFGPVGVDLRFYTNDVRGYSLYGDPRPDRWVLSVSYGFTRR